MVRLRRHSPWFSVRSHLQINLRAYRAKAAQQMQAGGQRPNMQQVQAMQKAMPPELLRQMRSAGSPQAAQKVMQEYIAKNGEGGIDMQSMMNAMMPGMGGMMGGGMPGMPGGLAR